MTGCSRAFSWLASASLLLLPLLLLLSWTACVAADKAGFASAPLPQTLPFVWPDRGNYKVDVDLRTISAADNATIAHSHVEHWVDLQHQRSLTVDTSDGDRGHPPSKRFLIQSLPLGCAWIYRPNMPCMKIVTQESQLRHVHLPLPLAIPAWIDTGAAEYFQQGESVSVRRYILYDNSGKMFEALVEPHSQLLLSATVKDTLQRPEPTVTLIGLQWHLSPLLEDLRGAFELPAGVSCPDYVVPDYSLL